MNTSNLNHVLGEQLIDVRQAALMFNLPSYWLSQAKERQERRIPHYRVGKLVRFQTQQGWKPGSLRSRHHTRALLMLDFNDTSPAGESGQRNVNDSERDEIRTEPNRTPGIGSHHGHSRREKEKRRGASF
ncbi:MAG: hypothetical protein U1F63_09295 [Chitinivorax sp.]